MLYIIVFFLSESTLMLYIWLHLEPAGPRRESGAGLSLSVLTPGGVSVTQREGRLKCSSLKENV